MKTFGIVLVVLAGLNLVVFLASAMQGEGGSAVLKLNGAFMCGAIGAYLIYRGNKKKQEDAAKEKWKEGK